MIGDLKKRKLRPIFNGSFMDYGAVFERQLLELYDGATPQDQERMREILKGKYDFEKTDYPRSSAAKGS